MGNRTILAMGNEDEQRWFLVNHRDFLDRVPHIQTAAATAFNRTLENATSVQGTIFHLGRVTVEDFMEILLLCGNGYGIAGLKLLRGMYERAVIARYLHQNPGEADAYIEYEWIALDKLIRATKADFKDIELDARDVRTVMEQAEKVRPNYMVPVCKQCGKERLNHTWSKLDFAFMAKQTGELGRLLVPAYAEPTRQIHGTPSAIIARLEMTDDGVRFMSGGQRDKARTALRLAHLVLIDVLNLQHEHFKLAALRGEVDICENDFRAIWSGGSE